VNKADIIFLATPYSSCFLAALVSYKASEEQEAQLLWSIADRTAYYWQTIKPISVTTSLRTAIYNSARLIICLEKPTLAFSSTRCSSACCG